MHFSTPAVATASDLFFLRFEGAKSIFFSYFIFRSMEDGGVDKTARSSYRHSSIKTVNVGTQKKEKTLTSRLLRSIEGEENRIKL